MKLYLVRDALMERPLFITADTPERAAELWWDVWRDTKCSNCPKEHTFSHSRQSATTSECIPVKKPRRIGSRCPPETKSDGRQSLHGDMRVT